MTSEQLSEIERLASLFMSPKEIALIIDFDIDKFCNEIKNEKSEIYKSYQKGKLKTKVEIRENIIKLAKHGSPQAQLLTKEFMTNQDYKEKLPNG